MDITRNGTIATTAGRFLSQAFLPSQNAGGVKQCGSDGNERSSADQYLVADDPPKRRNRSPGDYQDKPADFANANLAT
jgi:hypothetical protein